MPRGNDFSPVDSTETVTLTWDFAPWLVPGVVVSSPGTQCALISGTDPSPSTRLIGLPQVGVSPTTGRASQAVLQQISGMQQGAQYVMFCTVNTSDGQTLTLYANQICEIPT